MKKFILFIMIMMFLPQAANAVPFPANTVRNYPHPPRVSTLSPMYSVLVPTHGISYNNARAIRHSRIARPYGYNRIGYGYYAPRMINYQIPESAQAITEPQSMLNRNYQTNVPKKKVYYERCYLL